MQAADNHSRFIDTKHSGKYNYLESMMQEYDYYKHEEKLIEAIRKLISDDGQKFDEVLFDKFVTFLKKTVAREHHKQCKRSIEATLETFKDLNLGQNLFTTSHTKALKILITLVEPFCLLDNELNPILEDVWQFLKVAILAGNLVAVNTILTFFKNCLAGHKSGICWLVEKRYDPSLQICENTISDVIGLVKYYLTASTNYHIRNVSGELLSSLIASTCRVGTSELGDRLLDPFKEIFEQLLIRQPNTAIHLLQHDFHEILDIDTVIRRHLKTLLTDKNRNIDNLLRYLGSRPIQDGYAEECIFELIKSDRLSGLVIFASNLLLHDQKPRGLEYNLGPLLMACSKEEASSFKSRLEKIVDLNAEWIKSRSSPQAVTLCLSEINRVLAQKPQCYRSFGVQDILIDVLLSYIDTCNDFKNINSATDALKTVAHQAVEMQEIVTVEKVIARIVASRPIFLSKLKLACDLLNVSLGLNGTPLSNEQVEAISELIKLGRNACEFDKELVNHGSIASNSDILEEVSAFLCRVEADKILQNQTIVSAIESFMNGLYELSKGKDSVLALDDHNDLMGNTLELFILWDTKLEHKLSCCDMPSEEVIPRLVIDTLKNNSENPYLVEKIIKAIETYNCESYLEHYRHVNNSTIYRDLIRALCISLKGESDIVCLCSCLSMLISSVEKALAEPNTSVANLVYLKTLVEAGYFEILHEISTGSSYPKELSNKAKLAVESIRGLFRIRLNGENLSKVNQVIIDGLQDSSYEFICSARNENRASKAKSIAEFMCEKLDWNDLYADRLDDNVELMESSILDDIIDFNLKTDGISDCY